MHKAALRSSVIKVIEYAWVGYDRMREVWLSGTSAGRK